MPNRRLFGLQLLGAFAVGGLPSARAQTTTTQAGVVVMHGKGGQPGRYVNTLADTLRDAGFLVANLEMPWSAKRHYDVSIQAGLDQVTLALNGLRAQGATKVFLAGHSQGGLFALVYSGLYPVDGVIALAPGGQVDVKAVTAVLGSEVDRARRLVSEGQADQKTSMLDYEGARGTFAVDTTPAIYLGWFDPAGLMTTQAYQKVRPGTPVLYVSPKRDYPGLLSGRQRYFRGLPSHPATRLYEPDADHLGAPAASGAEAVGWIRALLGA